MKLKTLKDINKEVDDIYSGISSSEYSAVKHVCLELRHEAIKWYKEWERTNGVGSAAVLEFIKHFFNLEGEDLKCRN